MTPAVLETDSAVGTWFLTLEHGDTTTNIFSFELRWLRDPSFPGLESGSVRVQSPTADVLSAVKTAEEGFTVVTVGGFPQSSGESRIEIGFNASVPEASVSFDATFATTPSLLILRSAITASTPAEGAITPVATAVIDVKPGSGTNPINVRSRGVIPVAVLGGGGIDITEIEAGSLVFGPAGATIAHRSAHFEDVDGDGLLDLLAHFRTLDTGLTRADSDACLDFFTVDGSAFRACDAISPR